MMSELLPSAEFDQYAADYDRMLIQGLALSGEDKDFFAQGRINWLKTCLDQRGLTPQSIMDFGCGTGSSISLLHQQLCAKSVIGVDPSRALIERAKRDYGAANRLFKTIDEYKPCENADLVYCNGVFHHIPVAQRAAAAAYVWRALKPGGHWAFWENNPWNPGTRYIMSRVPFDRDAIPLCASETRHLLQSAGFHIVTTDYLFIFPKWLKTLRWIETWLSSYPLGGQYLVLGRKSEKRSNHV